ncbi:MAG: ABC transporter permease [Bacteroidaceae bacterium]|nr:ABC transporter permease [Bacteroidaceae bacterium]
MNIFSAFVKKEFFHIFRDRRTILILLVMPIVQIILFGFAISVEIQQIRVAFVVSASSPSKTSIQQLARKVDANEICSVTHWYSSVDAVDAAMKKGEIDVAFCFQEKEPHHLQVQMLIDAVNPTIATSESYYLEAIVTDFLRKQQLNTQKSSAVSLIQPSVQMLYNPQMLSAYNFVPGVMGLIFILICTLMTSISIVRETETGTMEILLVSPVRPIYMIFAKMVPYFVISCINLATILLLAYFLLHIPMTGSIISICLLSFLYIFLSLSLGLLISTVVKSQVAAMIGSIMGLMIPVTLLSGMIFPVENMPWALQRVTAIVPARWYISAMRKLMIEGVSITHVSTEIMVLVGMSVFVLLLAFKNFKNRL